MKASHPLNYSFHPRAWPTLTLSLFSPHSSLSRRRGKGGVVTSDALAQVSANQTFKQLVIVNHKGGEKVGFRETRILEINYKTLHF